MAVKSATRSEALHAFVRQRKTAADRLYGVVDAARDKDLAFAARDDFGREIQWLFSDEADASMKNVAPYLVPIEFDPRTPGGYLELWSKSIGNSAGILFLSVAEPKKLQIHLRNVFRAIDEDFRQYYFRFYDPRVLRKYLPTCTTAEAKQFFGPITTIFCEAESNGKMLICRPGMDGAQIQQQAIESA